MDILQLVKLFFRKSNLNHTQDSIAADECIGLKELYNLPSALEGGMLWFSPDLIGEDTADDAVIENIKLYLKKCSQ
jgi:hypothetical protein